MAVQAAQVARQLLIDLIEQLAADLRIALSQRLEVAALHAQSQRILARFERSVSGTAVDERERAGEITGPVDQQLLEVAATR